MHETITTTPSASQQPPTGPAPEPGWVRFIGRIGPDLDTARHWAAAHALALALPLALVALAILIGAAVVRSIRPQRYWRLIGWRLMRRSMRRGWHELAVNCGLSKRARTAGGPLAPLRTTPAPAPEHVRVPALRRIRPLPGGLLVTVSMLPGQVPSDFVARCEALANQWRVHAVRVTSDRTRRGQVTLSVVTHDPLTDVRHPSHRLEAAQPPAPAAPVRSRVASRIAPGPASQPADGSEALRVRVGTREDGSSWVLDLCLQHHWLIAGVTRSGKSNLLNAAVVGWAPVPNLAIVGIDLKGGVELGVYSPRLSALACDRPRAVALVRGLCAEMDQRYAMLRAHGITRIWDLPASARPAAIVLLIDEVAELFTSDERAEKALCEQASGGVSRLVRLGAAAGIHVIVCGQRIGSELGTSVTGIRAQLSGRVCHRVADPETAKMVFPTDPDAVEAALAITPRQPGRAIARDADNAWQPAHSYLTETAFAAATARRYAHLAPHLPALNEGGELAKTAA